MNASTASPPTWADSFEKFLRSMTTNKSAMSDLRTGRNKSPEECRRLHRWVSSFVGDSQVDTGRERAVYTVAAMFATHPDLKPAAHGLGSSLAVLRRAEQVSGTGLEARLTRLCRSATSQELCRNLSPIVSLLASGGVAVSWSALARDIDGWDFRADQITRRWLRDFFAEARPTDDDKVDEVTSTESNNTDKDS